MSFNIRVKLPSRAIDSILIRLCNSFRTIKYWRPKLSAKGCRPCRGKWPSTKKNCPWKRLPPPTLQLWVWYYYTRIYASRTTQCNYIPTTRAQPTLTCIHVISAWHSIGGKDDFRVRFAKTLVDFSAFLAVFISFNNRSKVWYTRNHRFLTGKRVTEGSMSPSFFFSLVHYNFDDARSISPNFIAVKNI